MTLNPRFGALFDATLPLQGVECPLRLRVPPTRDVHTLVPPREEHRLDPLDLGFMLYVLVERLDGTSVTLERAEELVTDPSVAARVPALRDRLFESVMAEGFARPTCPTCGHEAARPLADLFTALRATPRPLSNPSGNLEFPSLAFDEPRGRRPARLPSASRMRFTLPSAPVGLDTPAWGGVIQPVDTQEGKRRLLDLWHRWVPQEGRVEGKTHWDSRYPGFRAVMRAAAAVPSLEGIDGPVTPEVIEALPATDWLFLDRLYSLTRNLDVPDDAAPLTCPACKLDFLPVTD